MHFLSPEIEAYALAKTTEEPALLEQLNRETHLKVLQPRMLSGHLQGRLLAMISQMIRPKRILEIGTYTGYSALCLAEGLARDGELHTIELNEELRPLIDSYFKKSPFSAQVHLHIGDALGVIPTVPAPFDLVWIDADKPNYHNYFEAVLPAVRPGGFIMADNVLWSGKVVESEIAPNDVDTLALQQFNDAVQADDRVENVLLPIRDGIMVIRKK